MADSRGFDRASLGLFKTGSLLGRFSIPFFVMSLSDQHPYALFVAGGLRSPSFAKARVEVGDNADAYLASTDVVTFLGRTQPSPPFTGRWVNSRNGVCEK